MSVAELEHVGADREVGLASCRVCQSSGLVEVLSLGNLPLANSLLNSPEEEYETYPLNWMLCTHCSLVQLDRVVPPKLLFDDYNYLTSCSPPMVEHARALVELVLKRFQPDEQGLVVELGSNDGYLLQHYPSWVDILGMDPSKQAILEAAKRYIPTLHGYFGLSEVAKFGRKAYVVHANNVLAHVPDVLDFVSGIRELLSPDGVAIIEVPYLCDLVSRASFDTIYHEHVYYFSLTSLVDLFGRCQLYVNEVERIPTHGGSLRIFVSKKPIVEHNVSELLAEERPFIYHADYFAELAARVGNVRGEVLRALGRTKTVGFGAAAKATILLNVCGVTSEQMEYVADDTPTKQGKFIPGTGIKIVKVEEWLKRQPPQTMILCWNFAHDVANRYAKDYRGKFCTPYILPEEAHAHGQ
ncbi:MAG TPA: class I SAM-dependent methyltransferase [Verrucomicrobiae bacterium]|nr:class I SAM-dependent methyltransferase [Verrucomicrobiae bacterium]